MKEAVKKGGMHLGGRYDWSNRWSRVLVTWRAQRVCLCRVDGKDSKRKEKKPPDRRRRFTQRRAGGSRKANPPIAQGKKGAVAKAFFLLALSILLTAKKTNGLRGERE